MKRIATALVLMLAATAGLAPDTPHPGNPKGFSKTSVFESGTEGYLFYRIPSATVTKKGTVLILCEGRRSPWGPASDSGEINVVAKRSTDGGKTFGPQRVVWADGKNTCGNPTTVVDQETGTIVVVMSHNDADFEETKAEREKSRKGRSVWVTTSDDDGITWSPAWNITADVKKENWGWYATGPGIGIQLQRGPHKGRLVIPCNHDLVPGGPGTGFSHVIYSDDHGKTWKLGGDSPSGETNESQVVELADGSVMLNMRNKAAKGAGTVKQTERGIAVSHDGGETFGDFRRDPALIEPICQGSILRYSWPEAGSRGRILFANPASATERVAMTVRVSYDDGRTWAASNLIHKGWSCYSSLVPLPGGEIGLFFESGDRARYERIELVRMSLDWITAGKDAANVAAAGQ